MLYMYSLYLFYYFSCTILQKKIQAMPVCIYDLSPFNV